MGWGFGNLGSLTQNKSITNIDTVINGDKITMTLSLEDGGTSVNEIITENGYPVKIIVDGAEIPINWETVFSGDIIFGEGSNIVWFNKSTGATVSDTVLSGVATAHGAFGSYFYTQNKIDLTDYSKVKVNVTAASGRSCLAIASTLGNSYTSLTKYEAFDEAGVVELDVSDYSGEYYVAVIAGGNTAGTTFTADRVWLE